MGLGKLQIWIASEKDPCKISEMDLHDNRPWKVAIWHCDGDLLVWCGKKYFNMPAKCGHLEVELPPGCYVVRAAGGMGVSKGGVWGNHWTDHAIVGVQCDQTTCVKLFAPSAHHCGHGFMRVIERQIGNKLIPADLGGKALDALQAVLERIPKTGFDLLTLPAMDKLLDLAEQPQADPDDDCCDDKPAKKKKPE